MVYFVMAIGSSRVWLRLRVVADYLLSFSILGLSA